MGPGGVLCARNRPGEEGLASIFVAKTERLRFITWSGRVLGRRGQIQYKAVARVKK